MEGGPKAQASESRGLTSPQTCVPSERAGLRGDGGSGAWGYPGRSSPTPSREGHLDSAPLQQLGLPPVSKGEARREGGGDPLSSCAQLPCKALLKLLLPGLTHCCGSAAERLRRCLALRCSRRCRAEPIASLEQLRGWGRGARARAFTAGSARARARATAARGRRSRETAAPPLGQLFPRSREGRPRRPRTLEDLSEVLSSVLA